MSKEKKTAAKQPSLGYRGTVNISIKNGNKTIFKKTKHNTGYPNLFKYICQCLAGNYSAELKPSKIMLFTKGSSEQISNPDWSANTSVSSFITYNTTATVDPVVEEQDDGTEKITKYTVTYHFRIPYVYIITPEDRSIQNIYKMALYSANGTNTDRDKLATYLELNEDETGWGSGIEIDSSKAGNYSIIIDWIMTVDNINK